MKKTVFQKLMSLFLCAVMLTGAIPMVHAEDTQWEDVAAEGSEFLEMNDVPGFEDVQLEMFGLSDQDRQAILYRNMGTWYFPVMEEYFANIFDYGGCKGSDTDLFYGMNHYSCRYFEHAAESMGGVALCIDVPAQTPVMVPGGGMMYRSASADYKLGNCIVVEQPVDNGYSYYIIVAGVSGEAVIPSASQVAAGDMVAYSSGSALQLMCVMDSSYRGQQIADNLSSELQRISLSGWLTQSYGTGFICVNPSRNTSTYYKNELTSQLDGPITYCFAIPVIPQEPEPEPEQPAHTEHIWDSGVQTLAPTHFTQGEMLYTCTVCGETLTAPIEATAEHVFDQMNVEDAYLVSPASCAGPAVYNYSCACGARGETTFTVGEASGHQYAENWSFDEDFHWQAAICGHTDEKGNLAPHSWDAGSVTAQPTHTTSGEMFYTCTVCGTTKTVTMNATADHVFNQAVEDNRYLVSAATCTTPATYFYSCVCGEAGTETFTVGEANGHRYSTQWSSDELQHWQAAICEHTNERVNVADHVWDAGVVTVQPTSTSRGERTFTCAVCGKTRKEVLEPTAHEHTFSTTWTGNESYHWHAASCEHSNERSGFGEHNWNAGTVTVQPTHTTKGEVVYTCLTCGINKRVTTDEQHVFNQQNTSANYVKSYATCTTPATYFYSCSCGARGTETFTVGTAQGHSFAPSWNHDNDYHWRTCLVCNTRGEQSAHYYGNGTACQTCGFAKQDSHVHTSHLGRVPAKPATCTEPGNISYYVCECGKWFTDMTATVEITDPNKVATPATGHVDKDNNGRCDVCKERLSTETVEYTMTEGADSTWLNNSAQGLVFRCNADFAKFDHVEVDGTTISSLNYTVSSGSTIVELNANYMKRLTVGQHTISIVSSDGRANSSFVIKQGSASNRNEEGGRSVLWVVVAGVAILAMLAAAGVAGYILYTNKTKNNKRGGKFAR